MKVVSILGCGWLGTALSDRLVGPGVLVKGSTTSPLKAPGLTEMKIQPYVFDLNNEDEDNYGDFFSCDALVMLVPPSRAVRISYSELVRRAVRQAEKGSCAKIIFASSTSVYPEIDGTVTEVDADTSNPLYNAEQVVLSSVIPAAILRFAGLIGPGRHPGKFLTGKKNVSKPSAPVNLVHQDDAVRSILAAIETNLTGEIFNICADQHPSRFEYYTAACIHLGVTLPEFTGDSIATSKTVDNSKAREMLGIRFSDITDFTLMSLA